MKAEYYPVDSDENPFNFSGGDSKKPLKPVEIEGVFKVVEKEPPKQPEPEMTLGEKIAQAEERFRSASDRLKEVQATPARLRAKGLLGAEAALDAASHELSDLRYQSAVSDQKTELGGRAEESAPADQIAGQKVEEPTPSSAGPKTVAEPIPVVEAPGSPKMNIAVPVVEASVAALDKEPAGGQAQRDPFVAAHDAWLDYDNADSDPNATYDEVKRLLAKWQKLEKAAERAEEKDVGKLEPAKAAVSTAPSSAQEVVVESPAVVDSYQPPDKETIFTNRSRAYRLRGEMLEKIWGNVETEGKHVENLKKWQHIFDLDALDENTVMRRLVEQSKANDQDLSALLRHTQKNFNEAIDKHTAFSADASLAADTLGNSLRHFGEQLRAGGLDWERLLEDAEKEEDGKLARAYHVMGGQGSWRSGRVSRAKIGRVNEVFEGVLNQEQWAQPLSSELVSPQQSELFSKISTKVLAWSNSRGEKTSYEDARLFADFVRVIERNGHGSVEDLLSKSYQSKLDATKAEDERRTQVGEEEYQKLSKVEKKERQEKARLNAAARLFTGADLDHRQINLTNPQFVKMEAVFEGIRGNAPWARPLVDRLDTDDKRDKCHELSLINQSYKAGPARVKQLLDADAMRMADFLDSIKTSPGENVVELFDQVYQSRLDFVRQARSEAEQKEHQLARVEEAARKAEKQAEKDARNERRRIGNFRQLKEYTSGHGPVPEEIELARNYADLLYDSYFNNRVVSVIDSETKDSITNWHKAQKKIPLFNSMVGTIRNISRSRSAEGANAHTEAVVAGIPEKYLIRRNVLEPLLNGEQSTTLIATKLKRHPRAALALVRQENAPPLTEADWANVPGWAEGIKAESEKRMSAEDAAFAATMLMLGLKGYQIYAANMREVVNSNLSSTLSNAGRRGFTCRRFHTREDLIDYVNGVPIRR